MDFDRLLRIATYLLQDFSARDGAWIAFSGGKDSCVLLDIARRFAHVDTPAIYSVTTLDPPELLAFIHTVHPHVTWRHPQTRFFKLLERLGPPSRQYRWCCRELKESFSPPPTGALFTGVRAAESPRRARLCKQIMFHHRRRFPIIAPLFHWSTDDIWHYIDTFAVPYCALYDHGRKRIGCVGCPMSSNRLTEVLDYPYILHQWNHALSVWWDTLGSQRPGALSTTLHSRDEFIAWYWSNEPLPTTAGTSADEPCQLMLSTTEETEP